MLVPIWESPKCMEVADSTSLHSILAKHSTAHTPSFEGSLPQIAHSPCPNPTETLLKYVVLCLFLRLAPSIAIIPVPIPPYSSQIQPTVGPDGIMHSLTSASNFGVSLTS